jgi:molybdate transport system substrate-binding protein
VSTIKVLSTHAVFEVMGELSAPFERATGHRLSFAYDPASALKRQIEGGAAFDVAIATKPVIGELTGAGKILADTCIDLGSSGLGVSVRAGAPKPDIATLKDFKRALIAAKSVVRSKEGASGPYFEKLLERLGIAEQMRGKIVLGPSGRIAVLVAKGEAEMAVQQISELLPVTGTQFVGPFPAELQLYTVFSAGIGSAAQDRAAAKAFIDFIAAPSAAPLFKAKGLEPILR